MKNKNIQSSKFVLDNIKALRAVKNYNQEYVASKLGCDYSSYGKIENGKSNLSLNRLFQLADIFDVDVKELLLERGRTDAKQIIPESSQSSSAKIIIEIPLGDQASSIIGLFKDLFVKISQK